MPRTNDWQLVVVLLLAACGNKPAPQVRPGPVDAGVDRARPAPDATGVDASGDGGDAGDAGDAGSASAVLAVAALKPAMAALGQAIELEVTGSGFAPSARLLLDGMALPATRMSETRMVGQIPGERLAEPGFHTIAVTLDPADVDASAPAAGRRSNHVYLTVPAPVGFPDVIDLRPDNAVPGEKVRLVGYNLIAGALEASDGAGHRAPGGVIGTIPTSTSVLESVELTIPPDWQSGSVGIAVAAGRFRAKAFTVGKNLALLPGVKVTASSEYGGEWTTARGADNDLDTSWFTKAGDCVSAGAEKCKTAPWFLIGFPAPQTVARIALRGNREYTTGYDFLRARFEVLGEGGAVLWAASYDLPEPERDIDVTLPAPVANAHAVRFASEKDQSEDPGLAEVEVFGP